MAKAIKNLDRVNSYLFTPQDEFYLESLRSKYPILNQEKIVFDFANGERLTQIQKDADILYFPFSFDEKYKDVVSTMIGGKLLEYMISRSPILIQAPEYSAVVKYAQRENFAVVVEHLSVEDLTIAINKILNNKDNICETIVNNAVECVRKFHNAQGNSLILQKYLEI